MRRPVPPSERRGAGPAPPLARDLAAVPADPRIKVGHSDGEKAQYHMHHWWACVEHLHRQACDTKLLYTLDTLTFQELLARQVAELQRPSSGSTTTARGVAESAARR